MLGEIVFVVEKGLFQKTKSDILKILYITTGRFMKMQTIAEVKQDIAKALKHFEITQFVSLKEIKKNLLVLRWRFKTSVLIVCHSVSRLPKAARNL